LLEENANFDSEASEGQTPLRIAANHGHEHVVRLLIEHNANMPAKAFINGGLTLLTWTVEKEYEQLFEVLFERNASIQ